MFWEEKREEFDKERGKDTLKEAFTKVKTDIFTLGNEIYMLKSDLFELKTQLSNVLNAIDGLKTEIITLKNTPSYPSNIPAHPAYLPSYPAIPSNNPTVPVEIGGLKYPNFNSSSGNRGVPTDRQTNQQTDQQEVNPSLKASTGEDFNFSEDYRGLFSKAQRPLKADIRDASDILDSLDGLKKEIRLKFKSMTQQEMLVFSTIYQLEEQFPEGLEYKQIALKLKLSESSIRDYVQKLCAKGIPVDKTKLNNKKILLTISPELKKIAPLQTILKLREL